MNRAALAVLALVLVPLVQAASGSVDFRLEASTRATAALEGVEGTVLDGAAVAIRSKGTPVDVRLAGDAHQVVVERHEVVWRALKTAGRPARLTNDDENVTSAVWPDAALRLASLGPQGALVVTAESALAHWRDRRVHVQAALDDPVVRDREGLARHGSAFNADEVKRWSLAGPHLAFGDGPAVLVSNGSAHLYVSWADVVLEAGVRTERLSARAWNESDPTGTMIERHIVWYELQMAGARLELIVPDMAPAVAFAQRLRAERSHALAIDAPDALDTTLPEVRARGGSAVWVEGEFDAHLSAAGERSYSLQAAGDAHGYSVGGGAVIAPAAVALAAPGALAAVLALAYLFRDVVGQALARLGLPLYSKIGRHEILDSRHRETLYRAIQESPGISFLELQALMPSAAGPGRIAFGALAYHLDQLRRFDLIVSRRAGRYRRYFDKRGGQANDAAALALLRNRRAGLVARTIRGAGRINRLDLIDALRPRVPMPRTTLLYYLRVLQKGGLVARTREGRRSCFEATPLLRRLAEPEAPPAPTPKPPSAERIAALEPVRQPS